MHNGPQCTVEECMWSVGILVGDSKHALLMGWSIVLLPRLLHYCTRYSTAMMLLSYCSILHLQEQKYCIRTRQKKDSTQEGKSGKVFATPAFVSFLLGMQMSTPGTSILLLQYCCSVLRSGRRRRNRAYYSSKK